MTLNAGQILNGRYRIVELLGHGGFGAVYRAWDMNVDRPCAIKENFDTTPEAQLQFTREATTLANLAHTNLPRVTDHFILPGQGQYLVMDFIEGEDLETLLSRQGAVPAELALGWIGQIADALVYLHSQRPPVLHRDIKPANIRIAPDGRAVLVDFGLVKTYDPALRTAAAARGVTPGFAPLEQYGQGSTDTRTDVYALAATLYKLLTAQQPPESVSRVVNDTLRAAHQVSPGVSPAIGETIQRAMAVQPSQRYQSVTEFMTALLSQPAYARWAPPASVPPAAERAPTAPPLPWTAPGGMENLSSSGASPERTPPAVSAPAARKPDRRLWLLAGGLLACIAVTCAGAFTLSGLLNGGGADTPTATLAAAATRVAKPTQVGAILLPSHTPPPTAAPVSSSTPAVTPGAVDAALRASLRDAIEEADRAQIAAGQSLDTSGLDQHYSGDALALVENYVAELKAAGMYEVGTLVETRDWTFVQADADRASVTVTEVWSTRLYDSKTQGMLAFRENTALPQAVQLERHGATWKVASIEFLEQGSAYETVWQETFDSNDRGWYEQNGYQVRDGVYSFASQAQAESYAAVCQACPVVATFTYGADFEVLHAGPDGVYGLIFNTDTSTSSYTFYAYLVSPATGQFYFGKFGADRQWEAIQDWTESPVSLGDAQRLAAAVAPGRFTLFIGEQEVASVRDRGGFAVGTVGLFRGGEIEAQADNLRVDLAGVPER